MANEIITVPSPLLLKRSNQEVSIDGSNDLIKKLKQTLQVDKKPIGVGLAAVQIGISERAFIVDTGLSFKEFINPEILKYSPETLFEIEPEHNDLLEGCLSIPRIYGKVNRAYQVKVSYMTLSGERVEEDFSGLVATYIQHEYDHLEGTLFTMRCLAQGQSLFEDKNGRMKKIK